MDLLSEGVRTEIEAAMEDREGSEVDKPTPVEWPDGVMDALEGDDA